jgi:hypothetical protein
VLTGQSQDIYDYDFHLCADALNETNWNLEVTVQELRDQVSDFQLKRDAQHENGIKRKSKGDVPQTLNHMLGKAERPRSADPLTKLEAQQLEQGIPARPKLYQAGWIKYELLASNLIPTSEPIVSAFRCS